MTGPRGGAGDPVDEEEVGDRVGAGEKADDADPDCRWHGDLGDRGSDGTGAFASSRERTGEPGEVEAAHGQQDVGAPEERRHLGVAGHDRRDRECPQHDGGVEACPS